MASPTIGQLISRRAKDPDSETNPFYDGSQLAPKNDFISQLVAQDAQIQSFYSSLEPFDGGVLSPPGPHNPALGRQSWNPIVQAKNVANLGRALGTSGLAVFAATQLGLFALNKQGRVWNPLTALGAVPFTTEFIPAAADLLAGGLVDSVPYGHQLEEEAPFPLGDRNLRLVKGIYPGTGENSVDLLWYPPFFKAHTALGITGPQNISNNASPRLIGAASQDRSLVDNQNIPDIGVQGVRSLVESALVKRNAYYDPTSAIDDFVAPGGDLENNATVTVKGLVDVVDGEVTRYSVIDGRLLQKDPRSGLRRFRPVNKLFYNKDGSAAGEWRPVPGYRVAGRPIVQGALEVQAFPDGVIPVGYKDETQSSFLETTGLPGQGGQRPSDKVDDDEAYVPLSFTDLRPYDSNTFRTVYFRPFITSLSEEFSPEWNKQTYFGRTDPVMGYQATARSVNLAFRIQVFGFEDLQIAFQKANWLASFVYPEYDKDMLYKSGPVIRMRVGDLISSKGQRTSVLGGSGGLGLPGVIENLSFDYSEALWELKKGSNLPVGFNVTLSFVVLHDVPIGRGDGGQFGGLGTFDSEGKYVRPSAGVLSTTPGPVVNASARFRAAGDTAGYIPGVRDLPHSNRFVGPGLGREIPKANGG